VTDDGPEAAAPWPALPLDAWRDTKDTLQLWTQIVGKTRLALAPMVNHWWQAPLYVSARGLTTSAMPYEDRLVEAEFDFVDHVLVVRTDSDERRMALAPRSVADFYREYRATLLDLGLRVRIWQHPVEVETAIPFSEDKTHASYDAAYVTRFWRALAQAARVLGVFRGRFTGKCSPVHFFWGGFDLACTRFSGRPAPPHPGGIPNLADWVTRESYSRECASAGWWPGGGALDASFYAYAYPEPAGCSAAPIKPAAGRYDQQLRDWILPYDAVRKAEDPDAALLSFWQSTYDTVANLGGWDSTLVR
jgi:uncharacterized protein DUF5996